MVTEKPKRTYPKWIKLDDLEQEEWATKYLEKQLGPNWQQSIGARPLYTRKLIWIASHAESEKIRNRDEGTDQDFWQTLLKKMERSWRARASRKNNQNNLSVLLHQSLKQPLDQLCKQNNMSRGKLIGELILNTHGFTKKLDKQKKEELKEKIEKAEVRVRKSLSHDNLDKIVRMKKEVERVEFLAKALEESLYRESQLEAFIEQHHLEEKLEQLLEGKQEQAKKAEFEARSKQLFKDRLKPYRQTINDIQKRLNDLKSMTS